MAAKCKVCLKSVYPMDPQINLDGTKLHKACAKCGDCGCQITISNFTKNESNDQTVLLCKIHYFKRFHEGGSYLGGEKFRVMSTRDMKPVSLPPKDGASSTQEVEEAQPSVQALKTVFNVTKTETAPPSAAPIPDIKETETVSEIVPNETEESAASADNNDNSGDAVSASESPVPDAEEEELAGEVEDTQE